MESFSDDLLLCIFTLQKKKKRQNKMYFAIMCIWTNKTWQSKLMEHKVYQQAAYFVISTQKDSFTSCRGPHY